MVWLNNYLVIEKSFTYNGDLTLGKELTIKSHDNKVSIYSIDLQKVFISNKVYKKYLKLFYQILSKISNSQLSLEIALIKNNNK